MTGPTLQSILRSAKERASGLRPRSRELERAAQAAPNPRPFAKLFGPEGESVTVIAEVKRRSPSAGEIRSDLDPVGHALAYARGGARAISVLTDPTHFGGSVDDLTRVALAVSVPVLRKDFIVDELQVLEARAAGASAVLLIARAFAAGDGRLAALSRFASGIGLGTLVEVHAESELDVALAAGPTAIGVNSRDLDTFVTDMDVALRLVPLVPAGIPAVAESGLERRADVERVAAAGADAVLVGTAVARAGDPEQAVRELTGVRRTKR